MTRWARSGNTQKHKKMPGDATPWEEFAQKLEDKSHQGQNNKGEKERELKNKDLLKNKNISNNYRGDKYSKVHKFGSNLNTKTEGVKNRGIFRDNPHSSVYESSNSGILNKEVKSIKEKDNSSDLLPDEHNKPDEHNNISETQVMSKNQKRKARIRKFRELYASQQIAKKVQNKEECTESAENGNTQEDKIGINTMTLEKRIKKKDNSSDLIRGEHNSISEKRVLSKSQIRKAKKRKFQELHASQSNANKIQNKVEYSETEENRDKLEDKIKSNTMKLKKISKNENNSSDLISGEHNTSETRVLSKNQIRKAKKRKFLELHASQSNANEIQSKVEYSETAENRDKLEDKIKSNTMKLEKNSKNENNSSDLISGEHNTSEKPVLSKSQIKKAKKRKFQELHASQSNASKIKNKVEYSESAENRDKLEDKMESNTIKLEENIKNEDNSSDLIPGEHNTSETQVLSKNQIRKGKKRKLTELHALRSGVNKLENGEITNNSSLRIDGSSVGQYSHQKKNKFLEKVKSNRKETGIILLSPKIERKIYTIKKRLREKGLEPEMIKDIIRKERRTQELNLKRASSNKTCFNCRKMGHLLAECPLPLGKSNPETGICFKCGSTEHSSLKCRKKIEGYPLAKCFICKEQGHITRDCPKNDHGVYPKGGQCNLCGNINHLKKDCPTLNKKKEETVTLSTINEGGSIDAELIENSETTERKHVKKPKIVKF